MTSDQIAGMTGTDKTEAIAGMDLKFQSDWMDHEWGEVTRDAIINAAQRLPDQNRYLAHLKMVTGKEIPWDATAEQHLDAFLLSIP